MSSPSISTIVAYMPKMVTTLSLFLSAETSASFSLRRLLSGRRMNSQNRMAIAPNINIIGGSNGLAGAGPGLVVPVPVLVLMLVVVWGAPCEAVAVFVSATVDIIL